MSSLKRKRYITREVAKKIKFGSHIQSWLWRMTKIRNYNDFVTDDPIPKHRLFVHVHNNGVTTRHDCMALRQAIITTGKKIDYLSREPFNSVEMSRLDRICRRVDPKLGDIDEDIDKQKEKKERKEFVEFVWSNRENELCVLVDQINVCINDKYQPHFMMYLLNNHLLNRYRIIMKNMCELDKERAERLFQTHSRQYTPDDSRFEDLLSLIWFVVGVGVRGDLVRRYIQLEVDDDSIAAFL